MSFSFGTPSAAPTSGFSFGSAGTGTTAPSGFGAIASAQPSTAAAPSIGFGTSTSSTASSFGFGSTTTTTPAGSSTASTTPSFGFGTSTSAAPSSTTSTTPSFGFGTSTSAAPSSTASTTPSFGFGSTPSAVPNAIGTTTAFGGLGSFGTLGSPAPSSTTSFGGLSTFGSSSSTIGTSATGGLGVMGSMFGQPAQNQIQSKAPVGPVMEAIEKLQRSYAAVRDTNGKYVATGNGFRNDECNFKTIMLNKRGASTVQQDQLVYGELLEQAERDNTDPENYMPVEELGIANLKARYDNQKEESTKIRDRAVKIGDILKAVRETNQQLNAKFELLKKKQININKRVLAIVRKIEVLRCHGTPLQQSELIYRDRLLNMLQNAELPMKKLQDMSVNLALQEVPQDLYTDDISEEDLANLVAALKKQSEGIENLSEMLRKDVRDVAIVKNNIASNKR